MEERQNEEEGARHARATEDAEDLVERRRVGEELNGRDVHVYQVKPREKRAGLFKGRIYIDSSTGTLVRSEGAVVRSPSLFLRHIEFVQDYTDVGDYTFPLQLHTTARASFVGRVVVDVFHRQYEPRPLAASLYTGTGAGQP